MVRTDTIQNKFSGSILRYQRDRKKSMDMDEYLEEEEIQKLIDTVQSIQKKAFIAYMYECGARPEEFLRLTNSDIRIDSKGAVFILRGKTGERRVRIIAFAKLLQQWINVHPLKHQNAYPIWISEATNYKNNALGLRGAEKIIEEALPRSGLTNKHAKLYILRHSRATHLAKHLTAYNALIALNEGVPVNTQPDYKIKTIQCKRCAKSVSPGMNFCAKQNSYVLLFY